MLKNLLTKKKDRKAEPFLLQADGSLSVHHRDELFWIGNQPLRQLSSASYALEPFLTTRAERNEPLEASWLGDRLEVALERDGPARRYVLTVNPHRCTIDWTEGLLGSVDARLPRLEPLWTRSFSRPPWPARSGRTNLSAVWLPEGLLLLLGDWVTWLDPETGQVRGEWPMPGKKGTRAAVELLAPTEHGVLGSYRAFHDSLPPVSGMLLLRFDGQPRWKLIPNHTVSKADEPVESGPDRIVVEGRVAGDHDRPVRAQWVVDLAANRASTVVLPGAPEDEGVERCLSLAPHRPNPLLFLPDEGAWVGTDPACKLTALLCMPAGEHPEKLTCGALWEGRALAYELSPESLRLCAWKAENLGLARCRGCRAPLPNRAYHCACGEAFEP